MNEKEPAKSDFWQYLAGELQSRHQLGLVREIVSSTPISPTTLERRGKRLIHFGSNDYLSLAWHPELRTRFMQSASEPRVGSGASPAVSGASQSYMDLIHTLSDWKQSESANVFSSGYACNSGTLRAVVGREDLILSDALNHACLIDGSQLARCRVLVYPHCDSEALEESLRLHRHKFRFAFVVTDTVFSMDGDIAPVAEIDALCRRYDAMAIADEAHASGVIGSQGRGVLQASAIHNNRWIQTGTLSKAVGCVGGFVTGPKLLSDWLTQQARSWIYSTALPASLCAVANQSIQVLRSMDAERARLAATSIALRQRLLELGFSTRLDPTPIVPVFLGDSHRVVEFGHRLAERGFYVPAIRPPTVPRDSAMLRISLNVSHSDAELNALLEAMKSICLDSPKS